MDRRSCMRVYELLMAALGPRGWWPLPARARSAGFDERGYHPGLESFRLESFDRFQVCLGAILTQNTAWTNAEKALIKLLSFGVRRPEDILALEDGRLEELIRSSGYFRQKASRLKTLCSFLSNGSLLEDDRGIDRRALLGLKGIGPETADSMLLYAYSRPIFVVDAYTIRLLSRMGLLPRPSSYEHAQNAFHASLPPDPHLFAEYHALIVEACKAYCRKAVPSCADCPLRRRCRREGVDS